MSSIVTGILSSTVGLLANKARDLTAAKLKEGDVTDAKIRQMIVRELDDVKKKIDGLSREKLLSSYEFLEEGVDLLNVFLNNSKVDREETASVNETQDGENDTSTMPSGVQSGILNEAIELSHAMGKLQLNSDKKFKDVKKRFEGARTRATDAFCNEALSINDRIFAAKVRIVSEILEYIQTPEIAITGCLTFLKKLHSLPAIQEMFTVYLNKGAKSILNKAERVENVKSVMLINYVLFQYVSKFSSEQSIILTWSSIDLGDRSFNPILNWQEVSARKSMRENELPNQHPNRLIPDERIFPPNSVVNGHGNVIVANPDEKSFKVISETGISKVVKIPEPREDDVMYVAGLAVDNNNNVYVVIFLKTHTENGDEITHGLCVLDENYHVKQECVLDFLEKSDFRIRIAINTNNNIIMIKQNDPHVYVSDNNGKLKYKFECDSRRPYAALSISGQNEIMVSSDDYKAVHIYSGEGNLKSTIKLPEGHLVSGVAFHYFICKIFVLSYVIKKDCYSILWYTEAGELETSTWFCQRSIREHTPKITSYPSGPVAVVRDDSITFI